MNKDKLREAWHVQSVNMATGVTDYSKVEAMIFEFFLSKMEEQENSFREMVEGIDTILKKIKDIDQLRCKEASKEQKIYDVSVTSWVQTAEKLLDDIILSLEK